MTLGFDEPVFIQFSFVRSNDMGSYTDVKTLLIRKNKRMPVQKDKGTVC